jgi:tripartite-type tricarboxylate transporter receptor subunit TctC
MWPRSVSVPRRKLRLTKQYPLRALLGMVVCALLVVNGAQAVGQTADDWPKDKLRLVIPSSAGGGTDTISRGLQPFLEKQLGVSIAAENIPGANHALGAQALARSGPSCNTILAIYEPSLVTMAIAEANLDFTYDDFYPLGGIIVEPFALFVPNDSPVKDWNSLWEKIVNNPGDVRVGITSWFDVTTVHLLEMEEQLGVKFNIIRYDGGSKARAALLAGETDFGYHILFGSRGVWDDTRTLAHFTASGLQPREDISKFVDGSPRLQDLVKAKLTDTVLTFSLYVTSGCHSENPARYNKLVEALQNILGDPAYQAKVDERNMRAGLLGVLGDDFFKVYQALRPELEKSINRLVIPRLGE